VKIDLRKDLGMLDSIKFAASEAAESEMTEDERIAETMHKRQTHVESVGRTETQTKSVGEELKSDRKPVREFFLLITVLAVAVYYFMNTGIHKPWYDIISNYWLDVFGLAKEEIIPMPSYEEEINELEKLLSNEAFDSLMPMTDDIAALADSMDFFGSDSIFAETLYVKYKISDTLMNFLPVADDPIQLSDDDLKIINNRSLLLMLIEFIDVFPPEHGSGNIFLKRDALSITAPSGGVWVQFVKTALDKFVLGSFDENYSSGNIRMTSKFEIIMNAEKDFQAQVLDEMGLLDALAHPFNEYLEQIIIDLSKGVNDNPAQFMFAGSPRQIQYILSSWAETRSNILLRSAEVEYQGQDLILTLDILFFNYSL